MPRTHTGKAGTFNDKDFNRLIRIVENGNQHGKKLGQRNKTILVISYYLGLRVKEIASLNVSDVVNDEGEIKPILRLQAHCTKGNKHRDIPMSNPKIIRHLTTWVKNMDNKDAPLFTSQKGFRFSSMSMSRMISKLYKDAGFNDCSSHSGRRSMITKLINKGVSINKVKQIAGHSNIQTTIGYVDTNQDVLADVMKEL